MGKTSGVWGLLTRRDVTPPEVPPTCMHLIHGVGWSKCMSRKIKKQGNSCIRFALWAWYLVQRQCKSTHPQTLHCHSGSCCFLQSNEIAWQIIICFFKFIAIRLQQATHRTETRTPGYRGFYCKRELVVAPDSRCLNGTPTPLGESQQVSVHLALIKTTQTQSASLFFMLLSKVGPMGFDQICLQVINESLFVKQILNNKKNILTIGMTFTLTCKGEI